MDANMSSTGKIIFEIELDLLLAAPMVSEPSRKRPAAEGDIPAQQTNADAKIAPSKRIKTVSESEKRHGRPDKDIIYVHPARRQLLESPPERSQIIPPVAPRGAPQGAQTWRTLTNTVRRQWDPTKDDLDYEFLLEQRRRKRLGNVDRYVPGTQPGKPRKARTVFPLERLPEDIRARLFEYILFSTDPITIDFYWLRSFVRGHARVPTVMQSVDVNGAIYTFPMGWNQLLKEVQTMKDGMDQFKQALEMREAKTRAVRSPCRGLSTSLLRVSRKIHKTAAQVLYSKNTFRFPCATSACVQLDSFLVIIGAQNVAKIQHLQIHAPMWHRLIQEDFVEGAIIDSLSPATRMGVIKPAARDRLVSAIQNAVRLLSPTIKTFALELVDSVQADQWTGRYVNDKRFIAATEAEEHVNRKAKGVALLKQLSDVLAANNSRPMLSVCRVPKSPIGKKEFDKQVPSIKKEAAFYGWKV